MIIESIIKRDGGSDIELDDVTYEFRPNDKDDHVCEVKEQSHISRLLSIKEGFREYGKPSKPATKEEAAQKSTGEEPATETQGEAEQGEVDIRALYQEKFGKKPHHKMSDDAIRKAIEE